jgi:DNA mismatch repair protein MutL
MGLPQPPPWRRDPEEEAARPEPGEVRLHGFVSKPEIQKLNRNSIFIFVNGRLIRDRLIQHALTDAYRNILPPTVFPVVLLFLEMPTAEVDVNVHPSKTEVRFRQQSVIHDFVRDSAREALMKARPVSQFLSEINAQPSASQALTPGARGGNGATAPWRDLAEPGAGVFALQAQADPPTTAHLEFEGGIAVEANAAVALARAPEVTIPDHGCAPPIEQEPHTPPTLESLRTLRPLGQIRNSFILAVNEDGLWIIDQHVAHERVLFEKILRQRAAQRVESQRLLMPLVLELTPAQQAIFGEIAEELAHNGFEAEPFGTRSVAVKIAPAGVDASQVEHMLSEIFEQLAREDQAINLEAVRTRIAASIACHAAIKVNMPLEQNKMEWLLAELAKTQHPMSCPHGRPIVLRYSMQDIQKAFKRI